MGIKVLWITLGFMVIVLIANGCRGYAQGMNLHEYLIFIGYLPCIIVT